MEFSILFMPSSSLNQAFEVPVLYQDLRQPEAFNQICDALENLNRVVDGVFGSIKERVCVCGFLAFCLFV